jgi:hypothetical protein
LVDHVSRGLSGLGYHWQRGNGARAGFSAIPEQKLVAFVLALIVAVQHRLNTTPNSAFALGAAPGAPCGGQGFGDVVTIMQLAALRQSAKQGPVLAAVVKAARRPRRQVVLVRGGRAGRALAPALAGTTARSRR